MMKRKIMLHGEEKNILMK